MLKKLWKENRVLLMLFVVLIVCFVSIIVVALTFFYNKDASEYGNRLDNIEKYKITEKFKDSYENKLLDNEHVSKVNIHSQGRIIYVHITFDKEIDLEAAKNVANLSLENFDKKLLGYYDIEFILKSDNFTIMGAKNSTREFISWNNNTPIPEEEEENEK